VRPETVQSADTFADAVREALFPSTECVLQLSPVLNCRPRSQDGRCWSSDRRQGEVARPHLSQPIRWPLQAVGIVTTSPDANDGPVARPGWGWSARRRPGLCALRWRYGPGDVVVRVAAAPACRVCARMVFRVGKCAARGDRGQVCRRPDMEGRGDGSVAVREDKAPRVREQQTAESTQCAAKQRNRDAASKLSAETGLAYRPSTEGEHVSGVYRQRVKRSSVAASQPDHDAQLRSTRQARPREPGRQIGTLE
jgi:hypothetical protein